MHPDWLHVLQSATHREQKLSNPCVTSQMEMKAEAPYILLCRPSSVKPGSFTTLCQLPLDGVIVFGRQHFEWQETVIANDVGKTSCYYNSRWASFRPSFFPGEQAAPPDHPFESACRPPGFTDWFDYLLVG